MLITTNICLFPTILRRFHSLSVVFSSSVSYGTRRPLAFICGRFSIIYVSPNCFISRQLKAVSLHSRIPKSCQFDCDISSPMPILALKLLLPLYCCMLLLLRSFIFQSMPSTYISDVTGIFVDGSWVLMNGR